MKALAIVVASAALLLTAVTGSFAATHGSAAGRPQLASSHVLTLRLPFQRSWIAIPLQSGGTSDTGTGTPTTATPAATGTAVAGADPTTILLNFAQVYSLLNSAAYNVAIDENDQGLRKIHLGTTGNATCKNLALKGHLNATSTLAGTAQTSKMSENYVRINKKAWVKSKSTKNKWKTAKASTLDNLGVSIDTVLACPNSTAGSGSGSGDNSGPSLPSDLSLVDTETFAGVQVYHLRFTETIDDGQGGTLPITVDLLVGTDHFLPYSISYSLDDGKGNTQSLKVVLSKFGEKLTITDPTAKKKK